MKVLSQTARIVYHIFLEKLKTQENGKIIFTFSDAQKTHGISGDEFWKALCELMKNDLIERTKYANEDRINEATPTWYRVIKEKGVLTWAEERERTH